MEIKYPILILIFIVLFIVVFFFKVKNKKKNNIRIANTSIVKRTEYYKGLLVRYRLILYLLYGVLFIGLVSSSFLSARIVKRSIISEEKYNRDVMLCLDVSTSVDELNMELIDKYMELVDELKGERIGISIFNCTSYMMVPLTEDYDYLKDVLYKMGEAFKCRNGESYDRGYNWYDLYTYIMNGTLTDRSRGSSLVGDGLASCIYAFPKLDEKRTRSIILVTDNDVLGTEMISVIDAAKIAKKKNITVYSIAPRGSFKKHLSSLNELSSITGGKTYLQDDNVNLIVDEINKKETTLLEGKKEEIEYDKPEIPFVFLMLSFAVFMWIDKELIR